MGITVSAHGRATNFELAHAVLIYEKAPGTPVFVSVHEVAKEKGGQVIQPGTPATRQGLFEMFQLLAPEAFPEPEILPENVLAKGGDYVVWYSPPMNRQVWFNSEPLGGECSAVTPHPGLVFIVHQGHWSIFAYKGKGRPGHDTMLCQAPYFNVYSNGGVCTGNVRKPQGKMALEPKEWEEVFFRSYFTHPNIHTPKGLTLFRGGPFALWRALLAGKRKVFPQASLVETGETLNKAFERITKKGGQYGFA